MTTVAITGATGALGGRVARRLAEREFAQRLVVRDPSRAPNLPGTKIAISPGYHDRTAMTAAFTGADTVLLVSGRESATRVEEHMSAIDAAVDAGVRRIVYTSFLGASPDCTFTLGRQHWATEEHIRASGLQWSFLQNAMYLDSIPQFAGEDGVIRGPAGNGRTGSVSRDDVADAAVAVLTGDGHEGRTYQLTGAETISLQEAADALTDVTGRTITYLDETEEQAYKARRTVQRARVRSRRLGHLLPRHAQRRVRHRHRRHPDAHPPPRTNTPTIPRHSPRNLGAPPPTRTTDLSWRARCDRLEYKRASVLIDRLRRDMGRIHRRFLAGGVELAVNGEAVHHSILSSSILRHSGLGGTRNPQPSDRYVPEGQKWPRRAARCVRDVDGKRLICPAGAIRRSRSLTATRIA